MPESLFIDARLVSIYDTLNPWGRCEDFYIGLAGAERRNVLDVGCGTGRLACRLADSGHSVTGIDPSEQMLEVARWRLGGNRVEWLKGRATDVASHCQFDLIIMAGHVFQVLLSDQDVLDALKHLRSCLSPSGKLAFETRNKKMREWEKWTPESTREVLWMPGIGDVEVHNDVRSEADSIVTYETHFNFGPSDVVVTADAIRFMDSSELHACLMAAGFVDITSFGDWDSSEIGPTSPEIIIIAR